MFQEVVIGLINVFMGLDIFQLLPTTYSEPENWGKAVITSASALLVFGAVWAKKQHKANILLIWLAALVIYFGTHLYDIRKCHYTRCATLYIYGISLGVMGALIYRVYTKEMEGSKDKDLPVYEKKTQEEKPPAPSAPEESYPPSYEAMVPQVHVY